MCEKFPGAGANARKWKTVLLHRLIYMMENILQHISKHLSCSHICNVSLCVNRQLDISSKVLKFADDTKVFRKVTNGTDENNLQNDLEKLVKWSEKWQMLFNFGKCKCKCKV